MSSGGEDSANNTAATLAIIENAAQNGADGQNPQNERREAEQVKREFGLENNNMGENSESPVPAGGESAESAVMVEQEPGQQQRTEVREIDGTVSAGRLAHAQTVVSVAASAAAPTQTRTVVVPASAMVSGGSQPAILAASALGIPVAISRSFGTAASGNVAVAGGGNSVTLVPVMGRRVLVQTGVGGAS